MAKMVKVYSINQEKLRAVIRSLRQEADELELFLKNCEEQNETDYQRNMRLTKRLADKAMTLNDKKKKGDA